MFNHCSNQYVVNTSNYHDLIGRCIERYDELTCVTFNYDSLLEKAVSECVGNPFHDINSYIANPYKIIKLHGSWDWIYKANDSSIGQLFDMESSEKMLAVLNSLRIEDIILHNGMPTASTGLPCMVLPINTEEGVFKKKFVCPMAHVEAARRSLEESDTLLFVGWSGNEPHFNNLLNECCNGRGMKVVVIGGKGAKEVLTKIGEHVNVKEGHAFTEGFSGTLGQGSDFDDVLF